MLKIDPQAWPTVSQLLDEWLDLPPESRAGWIENLGPEYGAVAPLLRELLDGQTSADAGAFLNTLPAFCYAVGTGSFGFSVDTLIGPYRLIRELGHGGMGVVWLAERADHAIKRPVALKLPVLAVHPASLSERFNRERDILAHLTHPQIARLYDAGVADGGQPYLALEYVDGEPITVYCDRRCLPVRPRLKLLQDVLRAVQYAHTNLVVHRDLKPPNILVTGDGEVRLLDFGIAKLLTQGEAQETELTQIGGRALTPEYASPEQITGEPVTTASDVYSLGVVLYELLTGERPYRLKRDTRGGVEEAIVAAAAVRPSQNVRDERKARARASTPIRLARALKGDLDTIVLKALQKPPSQRYATADAFAQDIERYLRGEAVLAQPESVWYRTRKFVGRNKLSVSAAAAVIIALSAGLGAALWQAQIARVQTRTAEAEQGFLQDIFLANSSETPDPVRAQQTTARQLLDLGAKKLDQQFREIPAVRMSLMTTIAAMYADLGLKEQAYNVLRARANLAKSLYGPNDPRTGAALVDLALNIIESSHGSDRAAVIEEAGRILDRNRDYTSLTRARLYFATAKEYMSRDSNRALDASQRAVSLLRRFPLSQDLVDALRDQGTIYLGRDAAQSIAVLSEAARIARSMNEKAQQSLPSIYVRIADSRYSILDWRGAEESYRLALDTARSLFGEEYQDVIQTKYHLGFFLARAGSPVEGFEILRNALDLALRTKGPYNVSYTGEILAAYGEALRINGQTEEALSQIRRALDIYRRAKRNTDKNFAQRLDWQASCELELGHYDEAVRLLDESSRIYEHTGGLSGSVQLVPRAELLIATGRIEEARNLLKNAPTQSGDSTTLSSRKLEFALARAETELAAGAYDEAIRLASGVRDVIEKNASRTYMKRLESLAALIEGKALVRTDRAGEALVLLERSVAFGADVYDHEHSLTLADAQIALGECLIRLGNARRAQALLAQAKRIHSTHSSIGAKFVHPMRELEAQVRRHP